MNKSVECLPNRVKHLIRAGDADLAALVSCSLAHDGLLALAKAGEAK